MFVLFCWLSLLLNVWCVCALPESPSQRRQMARHVSLNITQNFSFEIHLADGIFSKILSICCGRLNGLRVYIRYSPQTHVPLIPPSIICQLGANDRSWNERASSNQDHFHAPAFTTCTSVSINKSKSNLIDVSCPIDNASSHSGKCISNPAGIYTT